MTNETISDSDGIDNGEGGEGKSAKSFEKTRNLRKSISEPCGKRIYFKPDYVSISSVTYDPSNVLQRTSHIQSIRSTLTNGTARFFGVLSLSDAFLEKYDDQWINRRYRYINRRYGFADMLKASNGNRKRLHATMQSSDNKRMLRMEQTHMASGVCSLSTDGYDHRIDECRESFFKLAVSSLGLLLTKGSFRNFTTNHNLLFPITSSFIPCSDNQYDGISRSDGDAHPSSDGTDIDTGCDRKKILPPSNKSGIALFKSNFGRSSSRTLLPMSMSTGAESISTDDAHVRITAAKIDADDVNKSLLDNADLCEISTFATESLLDEVFFDMNPISPFSQSIVPFLSLLYFENLFLHVNKENFQQTYSSYWQKDAKHAFQCDIKPGFPVKIQEKFFAHRRRVPSYGVGFGLWRKYFTRKLKRKVHLTCKDMDTFVDYRPFFTYWVTSVQVLVTLITVFTYGFGPFGFGRIERTADVLHTSVTLKHLSIYEQANFWFGPSFMDLVHLGAKFSPCMRRDQRIFEQIVKDRDLERETGCCVYNDGTGCFQSSHETCPKLIATLLKWNINGTNNRGRSSGAVCGQDPRYCDDPQSIDPYEWPDDITQWPICSPHHGRLEMNFINPQKPDEAEICKILPAFMPENLKHLSCEITGRPCCIQLHGQCRITTRDYCDFVRGFFHENATLCSQIVCLGEVCGMLPFLNSSNPDQFYRLLIPLFLHAGILHCALTFMIQWYYMRDLEKLIGWARIALLYIGSGLAGNLASAIFVPYQISSITFIFSFMDLIANPWKTIGELSLFMLFLFMCGLLPLIDNWAHLFGFIFGFMISLATFPYIRREESDRHWRVMVVAITLTSAIGLFVFMLFVFYGLPGFDCTFCEYFNCIPFSPHFCDNQGLRLESWLPI